MILVNEKLIGLLGKYKITSEQYFNLLALFSGKDLLEYYYDTILQAPNSVDSLITAEYIFLFKEGKGIICSNIGLTTKGREVVKECLEALGQKKDITDVDVWIDEYREIFAPAKFSGGRPIKGDKRDCIKKMMKFLNEYPDYSKEIVIKAARSYMKRMSYEGYKFVQSADYWINKAGTSGLAAECELVANGTETKGDVYSMPKTQIGGKSF